MRLKIKVEHEISSDPKECVDDRGCVCHYYTKRPLPKARSMPKCTLFDCLLDDDYQKCPQCIKASEIGILVE